MTVVVLYMYALLYANRNCYSKGIKVTNMLRCRDNVGLHMCANFHDHTYAMLCTIHIYSHHMRLFAIGYEYAMLPLQ